MKIFMHDEPIILVGGSKINSPLLVMHGEEDTIVPFIMGVEIFEKSNTQKSKYFIKNDDHMMNFDQNLISEIQKFIESLK